MGGNLIPWPHHMITTAQTAQGVCAHVGPNYGPEKVEQF